MLRKRILTVTGILANVVVISFVVLLVGIFTGQLRTRGLSILSPPAIGATLFPQRPTKTSTAGEGPGSLAAKEGYLTPSELRAEVENNDRDVIILDIRSREEFARGHIPSALNIPHDELHSRALDELPESKLLVISSFECSNDELSVVIRDELRQFGYAKVAVLKNGIDGWTQAGFVTKSSAYIEPRVYTPSNQPPNESARRR
jgi:rhodanese-related sulfurtransferase